MRSAALAISSPALVGVGSWDTNPRGWTQLAINSSTVLGMRADGTMWSWGTGISGKLGHGNTTARSSPVQIGALTTWSKVGVSNTDSSDRGNSFGVKTDGTLWAWGAGVNGGLGLGNTTDYSSPVQVGALTDWATPISGNSGDVTGGVGMALKTDGTLWSWGNNLSGVLGLGNITSYSSPVQVGALTNWSAKIASPGPARVAIKTDGTLWAWGKNTNGQLGLGNTTSYSSPVQVGALTDWVEIAAGGASTGNFGFCIAIKTDGTLWSWGYNASGQLGKGNTTTYSSPVQVGALTNWSKVGAGRDSAFAVKNDGTLWAWGSNVSGQLGKGNTTNYSSPVQVGALTNWNSPINCSGSALVFMGLDTAGLLWTCGTSANNKTSTAFNLCSPVQVGSGTNWTALSVSSNHALAIKTDGTLWAWGANISGQLGNGNLTNYSSPVQVGALTDWASVSAGFVFSMAIKTDGTLWAWGTGTSGQLGRGNLTNYSSPVQVGALTDWSRVEASQNISTSAIKTDGTLWSWGANISGQLGKGNLTNYSSPVQVGALTNWACVSIRTIHALAIKTDGTLWAWGSGVSGQLGKGNTTNYSSPVQVGALTDWSRVDAGPNCGAAIKTDGTLWTWGLGTSGQLGRGNLTTYSSPVQVGALTDWRTVASSTSGTEATKIDGTMWTWGSGISGQLALAPNYIGVSSPVQVGTMKGWDCIRGKANMRIALRK